MRFSACNRTRQKALVNDGEVATGLASRLRGLIGHQPLRSGEGLLIKPCQGIHTFGMRFPIDAIFLDSKGRVVRTIRNLSPNRIGPIVLTAAMVLEVPVGTLAESQSRESDYVDIAVL